MLKEIDTKLSNFDIRLDVDTSRNAPEFVGGGMHGNDFPVITIALLQELLVSSGP